MVPLVLLLIPLPPIIMKRLKPPLGPLRRSKPPYESMFNMRIPLFLTLFRSDLMSFMGWLPPKTNFFRTLGHVVRLGEIDISLKAIPHILLLLLLSKWFLILPSFLYNHACIEDNVLSKHWEELIDGVWLWFLKFVDVHIVCVVAFRIAFIYNCMSLEHIVSAFCFIFIVSHLLCI